MTRLNILKLIIFILPIVSSSVDIPKDNLNYGISLINKLRTEPIVHPDAYLNVKEIIQKYGYPLEVHHVQTEDGYILEMHRIPYSKNTNYPDPNRPVVLIVHGILCSSSDFVISGVEKGLAFILSDLGYDVWLGNVRGNLWSKNHIKLSPRRSKFWDFSWHEMGMYDLPAKIDYILGVTGAEKIFYIGHSQGTTSFFVMASERPEYNDKIRLMSALAPVAYMGHLPNLFFKAMAAFQGPIGAFLKLIGLNEFLPNKEIFNMAGRQLCQESSPLKSICSNILFLIAGFSVDQLNSTLVPVILSHMPAGAATKQLVHFGQEVNSGKFRYFDYGLHNFFKYGRLSPPDYKINNIKAPIALYYSENDLLTAVKDVEKFASQIKNLVKLYKVPLPTFNHLDFLWANDVVPLLYDTVISTMSKY